MFFVLALSGGSIPNLEGSAISGPIEGIYSLLNRKAIVTPYMKTIAQLSLKANDRKAIEAAKKLLAQKYPVE